jgi:hypothetical protein
MSAARHRLSVGLLSHCCLLLSFVCPLLMLAICGAAGAGTATVNIVVTLTVVLLLLYITRAGCCVVLVVALQQQVERTTPLRYDPGDLFCDSSH